VRRKEDENERKMITNDGGRREGGEGKRGEVMKVKGREE
jgi:hypothetical protein